MPNLPSPWQCALLLLMLALLAAAPAQAEGRRVALVIANSRYQHLSRLDTPKADGEAVAERLKRAGFELLKPVRGGDVQTDLDWQDMIKADQALKREAVGADIVLLFYSGHGMQMENSSYLVPVDLPSPQLTRDGLARIKTQLVKLDDFITELDQNAKVAVAVFDACREIPQFEQASRAVFGGDSPFRGLARPNQANGKHRILAYSASAGEFARDGVGHSPYAQAWLDEFDRITDKKDLTAFFIDVAAQVSDRKGQEPEVSIKGVHSGIYYLFPAIGPRPLPSRLPPAAPSPAQIEDSNLWDAPYRWPVWLGIGVIGTWGLWRMVRRPSIEVADWYYNEKKYSKAFVIYQTLASAGNARAQLRLGWMYANGDGIAQDQAQAVAWFRQAAEQGYAWGQYNLGWMYANGSGITQDKTQAVAWYRKAAEQGHARAQSNLGVMYKNGEGVAQDQAQAVAWFRQAAEQGDASAQCNLGVRYEYGHGGLPKDSKQAAIWYRKAIANDDPKAKERAERGLARITAQSR